MAQYLLFLLKSRDALLILFMLMFAIVFPLLIMSTCNVMGGCILADQTFGGCSVAAFLWVLFCIKHDATSILWPVAVSLDMIMGSNNLKTNSDKFAEI